MANLQFFRAVSVAESEDILRCGKLSTMAGSLEGKWLAESLEDAVRWGKLLYNEKSFRIVTLKVEEERANRFFRLTKLDNIGPARFVQMHELEQTEIVEVRDG